MIKIENPVSIIRREKNIISHRIIKKWPTNTYRRIRRKPWKNFEYDTSIWNE